MATARPSANIRTAPRPGGANPGHGEPGRAARPAPPEEPIHEDSSAPVVERIDEEATSKGGILIPDTAKEKPQEGKVVAVGKGKVLEDGKIQKLDVKKGDRVLFSKYGGTEITLEGEERLILREDDVLGILE